MKPDLIAEAITEQFGPRCRDFDPGCVGCQAWAQYDRRTGFMAAAIFLIGVALIATGVSIMIRYGFVGFPDALPGRIGGLVNVLLGAWMIRRSFK